MSPFHIPPTLIDPSSLPPLIMNSEPGSFARYSMQVRAPANIREANAINGFPDEIRAALEGLAHEIESGPARPLQEDTPDKAFWQQAWGEYASVAWLAAPWYLSEAYAYRRVLEATRYFQPGPWQGVDPFRPKKLAELKPEAAPRRVQSILRDLPADPRERFGRLLFASLWGNRMDLSYAAAAQIGRAMRSEDEGANLLVDDVDRVWDFLRERPRCRLAIVADNAGTELLMDLALTDFLLTTGLAAQIALHLKPQPFFVSDAMPQDVGDSLDALALGGDEARALAQRLHRYLADARLQLRTHWFYTSSLFFFQLPEDLIAELAAADFVIFKGDANYRRLVGDVHWPPTASFEQATAYLPTPLVALRTLKSELIVGLRQGKAERLGAQDPHWLVSGRYGIAQAR